MSCEELLYLNAKEVNRISYKLDVDTSAYTVTFRLKANIENTTVPLIEVDATKVTSGSTSTGYFDINLAANPTVQALAGYYYYEVELNDGSNPPIFYGVTPARCKIQTRLDNN